MASGLLHAKPGTLNPTSLEEGCVGRGTMELDSSNARSRDEGWILLSSTLHLHRTFMLNLGTQGTLFLPEVGVFAEG